MSIAVRKNEPINYYYQVNTSLAGTWTAFHHITNPIILEGVYWSGTTGNYLQLRDVHDHAFYLSQSGSVDVVDTTNLPLTVQGPVQYFDSSGSATIRLFGRFV